MTFCLSAVLVLMSSTVRYRRAPRPRPVGAPVIPWGYQGWAEARADVDPRTLRYFAAVAEQLHFGRAAEALHIAQPVLSRQIRALEEELKAQLFVRDKRATELTPAGRQLLADAGPLLASADALHRRVTRAARGPDSFTIGFMPGLIVTEAARALASGHPQLIVNVLPTSWD